MRSPDGDLRKDNTLDADEQKKLANTEDPALEAEVAPESKIDDAPDQTATDNQATLDSIQDDSNPDAKWYVVHTYSGHENKVAATLKQRIEAEHF